MTGSQFGRLESLKYHRERFQYFSRLAEKYISAGQTMMLGYVNERLRLHSDCLYNLQTNFKL